MSRCIYCQCDLPSSVPREHIIPRSFGSFKPDLTLVCVCSDCNGYFGSKLEWPMQNESIEGARRLQFKLEGVVGSIGARNIAFTVSEGEHWKGARAEVRTDKNGMQSTEILPQIGAHRTATGPIEWVLEKDLNAAFVGRYPKGSVFNIVGGKTEADHERLLEKLKALCPTFVYGGEMNPPFSDNQKIRLSATYQMNRAVLRCLCKIGFNYMALTCGHDFVLSREFDQMRELVRNDIGDPARRMFVKQKPIIAQEIITGERGTNGHVLTIEGRPKDRTLTVQLTLFNSIPYEIFMTREYLGHAFAKGHHFSRATREVSELKVKWAGPDFDPSEISW